ncbi:outer membrane lipoprotein [Candidatus Doolittlea endobia]|uniref:Outer membrane lipoprotein SlyB n=1 Tax=Candidatus Doolittlea endobia TaxID=1778262 RepID=A0A143WS17_9ENTR|nr:glycine zipper 2TM domain-containing protein [Candidatus Doolittlea endobia]CUX96545.1 Outer membrane lipoprotein SlyB precursor [Candidatus Doolittlea endobia]
MMKRLIVVALTGMTVAGCANNSTLSSDVYSASEAKQVQSVTYGTLMGIRPVQIQGNEDSNVVGAISGAVLGGVLGSTIGGGSGSSLASTAGAVAGSVAGSSIESAVNRTQGVELEVRKDDGNIIIVVQKQSRTRFSVGQRVALVSNGRTITVSPR